MKKHIESLKQLGSILNQFRYKKELIVGVFGLSTIKLIRRLFRSR